MMEALTERFGRRVKELRAAKRLTQEQLGQKSGVDYKYLGEIERGVKTASFATIEKLGLMPSESIITSCSCPRPSSRSACENRSARCWLSPRGSIRPGWKGFFEGFGPLSES